MTVPTDPYHTTVETDASTIASGDTSIVFGQLVPDTCSPYSYGWTTNPMSASISTNHHLITVQYATKGSTVIDAGVNAIDPTMLSTSGPTMTS